MRDAAAGRPRSSLVRPSDDLELAQKAPDVSLGEVVPAPDDEQHIEKVTEDDEVNAVEELDVAENAEEVVEVEQIEEENVEIAGENVEHIDENIDLLIERETSAERSKEVRIPANNAIKRPLQSRVGGIPDDDEALHLMVDRLLNESNANAANNVFKMPLHPVPRRRKVQEKVEIPSHKIVKRGKASKIFNKHLTTASRANSVRCKLALEEISQRFCHKMQKHLQKILDEKPGRNELCLKDVKEMMLDFGFVDEDEDNSSLYRVIRKMYPEFSDQDKLIPIARLDGVAGSTTLPKDMWDKSPRKKRGRKRKC